MLAGSLQMLPRNLEQAAAHRLLDIGPQRGVFARIGLEVVKMVRCWIEMQNQLVARLPHRQNARPETVPLQEGVGTILHAL